MQMLWIWWKTNSKGVKDEWETSKNANLDSDCYNCSHYTDNLVYLDIFFGMKVL